jgi:CMP-N,N'-diacetyllegionaminic acid synthase
MTSIDNNVCALIPARGGSKGIPRKNIGSFNGQPLLSYTIKAALDCPQIKRVIVSTDCQEIAAIASDFGAEVPFLRPAELASDEASGMAPVLHCLKNISECNSLILLQPTSPLRTSSHIAEALDLHFTTGNSVVSVTKSSKHPAWMYRINSDLVMDKLLSLDAQRRQDLDDIYYLNGAIYIASRNQLTDYETFIVNSTRAYIMDAAHSIDIDTYLDWDFAEFLYSRSQSTIYSDHR